MPSETELFDHKAKLPLPKVSERLLLQDWRQRALLQEHLKKPLYRCKKCGKEFYFKAKKSLHKSGCPKKEGDDLFDDFPKDTSYDHLFVKNLIIPNFEEGNGNGNEPEVRPMKNRPVDDTQEMETEQKEHNESNLQTLASAAVSQKEKMTEK